MKRPGRLIAFEGIDGSGKSSVSSEMFLRLRHQGLPCYYTWEPTNGRIGSYIRLHLMRDECHPSSFEALLYAADRVQHYYDDMLSYIEKGYVVISDRYVYSSMAYQGSMLDDVKWVAELNKMVPRPDLALYLRVSPAEALSRKSKKRRTVYEREGFLRKVVKVYEDLARQGSLVVVDASRPLGQVLDDCSRIVNDFLRRRLSRSHPL